MASNSEYARMVYGIMGCSVIAENIWRCSLAPEDVKTLRINNKFWEDVLFSWCSYSCFYNSRWENQIIWYNSKIKVANKTIMWKDAYSQGLKYVYQLFNSEGYKSDQEIEQQFGLSKMRYNSLKTTIPPEYKAFFMQLHRQVFCPLPPSNYDRAIVEHKQGLARRIYQVISEDVLIMHYKFLKWRQELGEDYSRSITEFAEDHMDIYKITNVPKYRSFQYRLLQRGIVTNIQLYKWNLAESDNCTFCSLCRETPLHLFTQCPQVKSLWECVIQYIHDRFPGTEVETSSTTIIFNRIVSQRNHVANFLCLITKQFIYRQRCQKKPLVFPALKAEFQKIERIEKFIAIKNNKIGIHAKKWHRRRVEREIEPDIGRYVLEYIDHEL